MRLRTALLLVSLTLPGSNLAHASGDAPMVDLRIHDLVLTRTILEDHDVKFDVTNAGPDAADVYAYVQACTPTDGRCVWLAYIDQPRLAPGATASFDLPWRPMGQVGDVEVQVTIVSFFDVDPSNNLARGSDHVLVAGLGGATLL